MFVPCRLTSPWSVSGRAKSRHRAPVSGTGARCVVVNGETIRGIVREIANATGSVARITLAGCVVADRHVSSQHLLLSFTRPSLPPPSGWYLFTARDSLQRILQSKHEPGARPSEGEVNILSSKAAIGVSTAVFLYFISEYGNVRLVQGPMRLCLLTRQAIVLKTCGR